MADAEKAEPKKEIDDGGYLEDVSRRDWLAGMIDIPWETALQVVKMRFAEAKLDRQPTVADVLTQRALLRYLEADEIILRGKP